MPADTKSPESPADEAAKPKLGEKIQTLSTGAAVGAALGTIGTTSLGWPAALGAVVAVTPLVGLLGPIIGAAVGVTFANSLSHSPAEKVTKPHS